MEVIGNDNSLTERALRLDSLFRLSRAIGLIVAEDNALQRLLRLLADGIAGCNLYEFTVQETLEALQRLEIFMQPQDRQTRTAFRLCGRAATDRLLDEEGLEIGTHCFIDRLDCSRSLKTLILETAGSPCLLQVEQGMLSRLQAGIESADGFSATERFHSGLLLNNYHNHCYPADGINRKLVERLIEAGFEVANQASYAPIALDGSISKNGVTDRDGPVLRVDFRRRPNRHPEGPRL